MQILAYSILHFLTDGLCAFAMYATFRTSEKWYLYILIYNFCAFALQVLFGAAMDLLRKKKEEDKALKKVDLIAICICSGIVLTIFGAFTHPALLGIGNALFHVGGGIGTIDQDRRKQRKGMLLGIFVAPGALGLYFGTFFGKIVTGSAILGVELILASAFVLSLLLLVLEENPQAEQEKEEAEKKWENIPIEKPEKVVRPLTAGAVTAAVLCFFVVVIRSYVGLSVSFSWNEGFVLGVICTLAVVLGKVAGGFLSARLGTIKVVAASLVLAAIGYTLSSVPACGILGLFFFNMTMPITLYLIVERFDSFPGFSFGLLTLALFFGFLPSYLGAELPLSGAVTGQLGSIISLALLLVSAFLLRGEKKDHKA